MKWSYVLSVAMLAGCSCSKTPEPARGDTPEPRSAASPMAVDLNAVELLAAMDSFATRDFPKAWVDRISFRDFRDSDGPLGEDSRLLNWVNEIEISLAFRGLVELTLDLDALQPELNRLIEARDARRDPDAVVITVGRMAASPKLLVAELSHSGDRYSGGYHVVWRKTPKGWVYHDSTMTWIACG